MKNLENWKRWLVWLLLATLFSVACVFLSQWQFSRRAEAVAKIDLINANYDQPAVAIDNLATLNGFDSKNEWRPTLLTGRFVPEAAVLVRNRPYNGQAGFLQVVPFQLNSGEIVAVETGWLPTGSGNAEPDLIPVPTTDERSITARVRAVEPTLGREAPAGQIATLNIDSLLQKVTLSGPVYKSVYARIASSYSDANSPKVLARPELTEGNHLSYALQWILFALMAFSVLWWAIRQEAIARRIKIDPSYKPKIRKKFGDTDKAAEDSILERENN